MRKPRIVKGPPRRAPAAKTGRKTLKPVELEASLRHVLASQPQKADALFSLAKLLQRDGRLDEAIGYYEKAIAVMADPMPAYIELASCHFQKGRDIEALAVCRTALCVDPADARIFFNIGNSLRRMGKLDAALESFIRATDADPYHVSAWVNLGSILKALGHGQRALMACRRAAALVPATMEAYSNFADTLREHGRVRESIPWYARAFACNPGHALAHSNLLLTLNYAHGRGAFESFNSHRFWGITHADPLTPKRPVFPQSRDPQRKLRIGFVSGDFRVHSVAYFLLPLVEGLDRIAFDTYCYSTSPVADEMTLRFARAATVWRHDPGIGDARLAEVIRDDAIDILIDVAGHTGNNRLLAFARKPAPVQATWLGYPNTSGMLAMDWRISDAIADPPGLTEAQYVERLARIPNGFLCYRPPNDMPEANPLPALSNGHVTFVSFNNVSKVTPEVVALWSRVLRALPDARLVLKSRVFLDPTTRNFYEEQFVQNGVSAERITLLSRLAATASHLAAYHDTDIGLDPFPYNGTTTTCEALAMGVPVVTLMGEQHAGRVGASILTQMGLTRLIARDEDDYVRICVELASNLPALAALRQGLRLRMERSPLRDEAGFARSMGIVLRDMWQDWCFAQGR